MPPRKVQRSAGDRGRWPSCSSNTRLQSAAREKPGCRASPRYRSENCAMATACRCLTEPLRHADGCSRPSNPTPAAGDRATRHGRDPRRPSAIACHPRLPGASVPGTSVDALNVRPPSSDRAVSSTVPAVPLPSRRRRSTAVRRRVEPERRLGGCSPLTRASPGVEFTRTGAENLLPPSSADGQIDVRRAVRLAADQAAATNSPSAVIETFAFERPGTARVVVDERRQRCAHPPASHSAASRAPAHSCMFSDSDRSTA